jgi:flagellar protein FlgJ
MASGIVDPSFYADFSGLTSLKKDVKGNDPQAIRAAARQFESLFTDMVLKSMREAKLGDGLGDSQESEFYQDMYDQQLALQMSQGKGLGLADLLVQQLMRRGLVNGASGSVRSGSSTAGMGATQPGAAGASSAASPASHAQRMSFVRALEPYAQQAAAQLGVSPDSVIAQAALETGWGRHVPAAAGTSSHNLFGIKAGADFGGATVSGQTTEFQQGAPQAVTQSFRAYSSVQQGVNDYVTLLRREPGYQAALGTGEDVGAFAHALARGGYSSDPDYVQKLVATAASVRALRAGFLKSAADMPLTRGSQTV